MKSRHGKHYLDHCRAKPHSRVLRLGVDSNVLRLGVGSSQTCENWNFDSKAIKPSSSFVPKTHPLPRCFDAGGPLHWARRGGALLHSPIRPLSPTSTPSTTPPSSPPASSNRSSPPPSTFTATKVKPINITSSK
ncbi:hypothetical protein PIB30_098642 [Stylosanthes scabra]|uniref:Uncharacterized protein n=1 Tax=Stylosanthes scabra TaxID=79078 RepID=A0ABU6YVI4_9FABA|nr:hypothetical protein [Stylosanthes scabra]